MTATLDHLTITGQHHAAILDRCAAILDRACDRAWETSQPGIRVVADMGLLDAALREARRDPDGLAVHAAETAAENLLITIRRECGGDEADYVGGDE